MTMGHSELLEYGQRCRIRRGRRTAYGTTGRMEQRMPPPSRRCHRTFPGATCRLGEADAAVDSAGAVVPFRELWAGQTRRRAMPEYISASGRLDYATFRERAKCFADSLGAKARARHRLESGAIRVPVLGFRRQARWLTAPGPTGDRADRRQNVTLRLSLSNSFYFEQTLIEGGREE
jgi:hypothetical protein